MAKKSGTITGADLLSIARRVLGRPYQWGGTGPSSFDCSGLVLWTCQQAGISGCPRTSQEQWTWCEHVTNPGPGDLAFFAGSDGTVSQPGHVGFYTSPGQILDAPFTGTVVRYDSFSPNIHTGFAAFTGYGRIPKTATSSSANTALIGNSGLSGPSLEEQAAGGAAAFIGALTMVGAVIFLIVAFAAVAAAVVIFH